MVLTFKLICVCRFKEKHTGDDERERETRKSSAFPKMEVSPEAGSYDEIFSAEDEDQCRICRSPEEPGNPLRYPCLCRGSIKYVHQDCLRTWLSRRGNNKCEVVYLLSDTSRVWGILIFFRVLALCVGSD